MPVALADGIQVGILGPLAIQSPDGSATHRPSPGEGRLLVALLLTHGHTSTTASIAERVWTERLPGAPLAALHTLVSRLRASLKAVGITDMVETVNGGYALHVDPDNVDSLRFEQVIHSGIDPSDPAAGSSLRAALDLWRGEALEGLRSGSSAFTAEALRLEELRMSALELRIEADLFAGRHREVLPELEALAISHPVRENIWAHLMVAFYRAGRQADALAAFRRLRAHLGHELGIEPSRSLAALELAILNQDPGI